MNEKEKRRRRRRDGTRGEGQGIGFVTEKLLVNSALNMRKDNCFVIATYLYRCAFPCTDNSSEPYPRLTQTYGFIHE